MDHERRYVGFYLHLLGSCLVPGLIFQTYICCKARLMDVNMLRKINLIHSMINSVLVWILIVMGAMYYHSLKLFIATPHVTFLHGIIILGTYMYLAYWSFFACCYITFGCGWAITACCSCFRRRFRNNERRR